VSTFPFSVPSSSLPNWENFGVSWAEPKRTHRDQVLNTTQDEFKNDDEIPESKALSEQLAVASQTTRSDARFSILSGFYTIRRPIAVQDFLSQQPGLIKLLFAALPKMKEAWGSDVRSELELLEDPDDFSSSLVVYVVSKTENSFESLDRFDRDWWIDHVGLAEGSLSFSVQME